MRLRMRARLAGVLTIIALLASQAPVAGGGPPDSVGGDQVPGMARFNAIIAKMRAPRVQPNGSVHPGGMSVLSDQDLADLGMRRGTGRCAGLYQAARLETSSPVCTHGIDVADYHGGDYTEHPSPAGWTVPRSIPCYSQGPFVEVLWVYPAGATNRLATMRETIRQAVAATDLLFRVSAAAVTDGSGKAGIRAVRWAMDAGCKLRIRAVSTSALVYNLFAVWDDLIQQGVVTNSAKYLVLADAGEPTTYCEGAGALSDDDRPEAWNQSNGGGDIAYIYPGCFDLAYDIADAPAYLAHELMHTLGAVQHSAPHATPPGHCWDDPAFGFDGADIMCYDDQGVDISYYYSRCPSTYPETFDCGKDDYFNPFPAASSYLATHWNTARNIYLSTTNATTFDLIAGASLAPFKDIPWTTFEYDIVWLYQSGITSGCSATTYCPTAPVTRGQMAAFLDRGLSLPSTSTDYFSDDNGTTFETNINRLAASGITKGCTPTTFCPSADVTRGQMAAFLVRALNLPTTSTDYFSDDNGTTFEQDINRLAAAGITTGCTATTFCPTANVTRGQMAAFLHRALG